jgi:hypothetical protein
MQRRELVEVQRHDLSEMSAHQCLEPRIAQRIGKMQQVHATRQLTRLRPCAHGLDLERIHIQSTQAGAPPAFGALVWHWHGAERLERLKAELE